MRVLQLIETLRTGGAETSVLAIAAATPSTETVVLPLRGPIEVGSDARAVTIAHPLDAHGRLGVTDMAAALQKRLRDLDVDVVHSTLFYANLVARLALATSRVPLVTTVVGDSYGPLRKRGLSAMRLAKLAFVQLADGVTARRTDAFIFISEALRASHTAELGLDPQRCSVIYRGRALERFTRAASSKAGPHLVCVGRLVESKRTEVAIRALAVMRNDHPSARLTVVGDGPRREYLERLTAELGVADVVRFLGTRTDVPELLSTADIFVFPSAHEGLGGALVEAMAAGLPIVASNIPVIAESVDNRESGILVGVDDERAVAAACSEIWARADRGASLGNRAKAVAFERFDVRRIGEAHADVYRRLVDRARP